VNDLILHSMRLDVLSVPQMQPTGRSGPEFRSNADIRLANQWKR
jgi:hypothetical protein